MLREILLRFIFKIFKQKTMAIKILRNLILFSSLLILGVNLYAQDDKLKKEVYVVRPYEPSISDAFKINLLPKIEDTLKFVPDISYSITQRPINTNFSIMPIAPAKMLAEPKSSLLSSYVKIGFGNYTSPLAEIFYNNKRSNDYNYGAWLTHYSSYGRIKSNNGEKVDSDYGRTNATIFGKKILKKSILAIQADYENRMVSYFGYPKEISYSNGDKPYTQKYNSLNSSITYNSTHTDSTHLNYKFHAGFNHFADDSDMAQNLVISSFRMDKFLKQEHFGGEIVFRHFMNNALLDSANNTIITVSPWINLYGKQWRVLAGVTYLYDAYSTSKQTFFYPKGLISYDIISHYFIPYIEISGYLEENSYSKISQENPWITPGTKVWNTSHKLILTGGIKGNFSSKVSYNVNATYSLVDSMYFFVNSSFDAANPLLNRFKVVSDNIVHKKVMGEISYAVDQKITLILKADFNSYTMNNLDKPWHLPDYNAFAMLKYSIKNKFIVGLELYSSGNRYVQTFNATEPVKKLEGLIDMNIGLEYRYTKRLSAFINLNNITSNKYDLWYLYPMHRFNAKIGITYSF